ncbi:hypothetical protein [Mesorhizobium sp. M7A.F.Ca.US.011.01.1.1]|uniref:hypothetical protein n=1 Tax=Mesorhizobium sp. M7A.F.Ca.US.011.01.1.1 TaxID=2496741 RepID=UPI000FCA90FB|nr:hypothetical protein [Mesorhizobium sp. M7A.F.Ca.US.011.01.1.1]
MPAAEVMPTIGRFSRRAMFGVLASLPLVGSVVAAPAIVDIHPDAELLRLDAEMGALQAQSDQIGRDLERLEAMAAGVATVTAKEDDDLECSKAMWVIGHRIFAIPAHTLEGMAVKLRASDSLGLDDFPDNEAFASIAADIRRIAAGGAGATAAAETIDDRIRRLSGDLFEAMDEWAEAPGDNAEAKRLWLARAKS